MLSLSQNLSPTALRLTFGVTFGVTVVSALLAWPLVGQAQVKLPIGVDQEVFTKPRVQFNPRVPLKLVVINYTGYPLEYGLTDPRSLVTELPVDERLTLSNFRIPNCLAINTPMYAPVQYIVSVDRYNTATVQVKLVNDVSGDHCLDIQPTGAIFVN
ncbi:MAG: hypothetical protein NW237_15080 [Cyanobacteriota bacterium]|nr:hypothetical protein [Cyanobacteriota bacterium]